MMKAILKKNPLPGAAYEEVRVPEPGADEVLIEIKAAAICGTDIHLYNWDSSAVSFTENFGVNFPLTLGHEVSGVITALGSGVKDRKIGDRVSVETHIPCGKCYLCGIGKSYNCMNMGLYGITYDGAFAEYALSPSALTYILPDSVSFREGALFEPAGVAVRAVGEAHISPGDTVVVYGCGPIGLVAAQASLACGAGRVISIDINKYRLAMAEKTGATPLDASEGSVTQRVRDMTRARGGADVVLELTGAGEVYDGIFELIRLEGKLVTVGHPAGNVSVNITRDFNQKGISIKGIFGRKIWSTWHELASLLEGKKLDLAGIVTHEFEFSEYEKAFETTGGDSGKILLLPDAR